MMWIIPVITLSVIAFLAGLALSIYFFISSRKQAQEKLAQEQLEQKAKRAQEQKEKLAQEKLAKEKLAHPEQAKKDRLLNYELQALYNTEKTYYMALEKIEKKQDLGAQDEAVYKQGHERLIKIKEQAMTFEKNLSACFKKDDNLQNKAKNMAEAVEAHCRAICDLYIEYISDQDEFSKTVIPSNVEPYAMPFQRIMRYPMLLDTIKKNLSDSSVATAVQNALKCSQDVSKHVDTMCGEAKDERIRKSPDYIELINSHIPPIDALTLLRAGLSALSIRTAALEKHVTSLEENDPTFRRSIDHQINQAAEMFKKSSDFINYFNNDPDKTQEELLNCIKVVTSYKSSNQNRLAAIIACEKLQLFATKQLKHKVDTEKTKRDENNHRWKVSQWISPIKTPEKLAPQLEGLIARLNVVHTMVDPNSSPAKAKRKGCVFQ